MKPIIGVDFDNTLIRYEKILYEEALKRGWVNRDVPKNKKAIRDSIRLLPEGEELWQELQAYVYGEAIDRAEFVDGVSDFFQHCRELKRKVYIVSHKTEFASKDKGKINLRLTALKWMRNHRFFDPDGLGLKERDVFFESTRESKIERIQKLECTHFVDDLEETFLEDSFPLHVKKILFAPLGAKAFGDVRICRNWKAIIQILN